MTAKEIDNAKEFFQIALENYNDVIKGKYYKKDRESCRAKCELALEAVVKALLVVTGRYAEKVHNGEDFTQSEDVEWLASNGVIPNEALKRMFDHVRWARNAIGGHVHLEEDVKHNDDDFEIVLETDVLIEWGRSVLNWYIAGNDYFMFGLKTDANQIEIEEAYRAKTSIYRTAEYVGVGVTQDMFDAFNNAFAELTSPKKKKKVDKEIARVESHAQDWISNASRLEQYRNDRIPPRLEKKKVEGNHLLDDASPSVIVAWVAIMLFPICFRYFFWKVPQHMTWYAVACVTGVAAIYGLVFLFRILDFTYAAGKSIVGIVLYGFIVLAAVMWIYDPQMKPKTDVGSILRTVDIVLVAVLSVVMVLIIIYQTYLMIRVRPILSAVSFGVILIAFAICAFKMLPSLAFTIEEGDYIELIAIEYYDNGDEMLEQSYRKRIVASDFEEFDNPEEAYKQFIGKHQLDSVELTKTIYEEVEEESSSKSGKKKKSEKKEKVKKAVEQVKEIYYVNKKLSLD